LREEYRLRVFENRMLRRIFGPEMDEVTGGWRELHNKEIRTHGRDEKYTQNFSWKMRKEKATRKT
jgi:hypothetical protein